MKQALATKVSRGLRSVVLIPLITALSACSQPPPPETTLTVGTGALGGNYHKVGHALTRLWRDRAAESGFTVDYETSSGSVSNVDALGAGEIQFGIVQADHQFNAVNGRGEWNEVGPQAALRSVVALYDEYVTLVAAGDSGILSMADLAGKRVDIGTDNSGTQANAIDALNAAGFDWAEDVLVQKNPIDERLSRFMGGEVDAFFFTTSHPNTELKFASYSERGARYVSLENIDVLLDRNPFYSRVSIPVGMYPKLMSSDRVATVGVTATLLTTAAVPDDVVYAVTKTLLENLTALDVQDIDLNALEDRRFLDGLTAPLHPGALRYYEENGIEVPENLR